MINDATPADPAFAPDELRATIDRLLSPQPDPATAAGQLKLLADHPGVTAAAVLETTLEFRSQFSDADPAVLATIIRLIHTRQLNAVGGDDPPAPTSNLSVDSLGEFFDALPDGVPNRHLPTHLLALIGAAGDDVEARGAIDRLIGQLRRRPPKSWVDAAQVLSPLMQSRRWPVDAFFPESLDLIANAELACPILDLAAFVYLDRGHRPHVAASRAGTMTRLLGEVIRRLKKFEVDPHTFGDNVDQVSDRLSAAVSLAVTLCNNLGLIGADADASDSQNASQLESMIERLCEALELRHRRVQCEAAGALARLDQDEGRKRLIELATDPVSRLRAIAYADELEFGDAIADEQRTEAATAEAEVALWLSAPAQMGVPPTSLELVSTRCLSWPGYETPVNVYLVRFEYDFGSSRYSNVAIAGPVTFALSADLADLPMGDIYAMYAGWHVDHDEIFTVPPESFNTGQRDRMVQIADHLKRSGYENLSPKLLGLFLDESAGVFSATREVAELLVVSDGTETIDAVISGRLRPMNPGDIFNLFKGRKILRTFNPDVVLVDGAEAV